MNKKKKPLTGLSIRLFLQMLAFGALYTFLGIALFWLFGNLYHRTAYQADDLIYRIVQWLKIRWDLFAIGYFAVGYLAILFYFWRKPFAYLQEVSDATDRVYRGDNRLIELSDPLKEIEKQMNQTKVDLINKDKIAKDAEQRKNDLITYLAHDLKTPVTSVIGYLSLLRDEPDISAELRAKYTGIALNKAQRLEDLINELFDITRFSLSKLTLEPERIGLSRMLEQITSEFIPILAEKELVFHTEIEPNIEIVCDPNKLERVFDNLIRNAVSYSTRKTAVFLSLRRIEDAVEIIVQNKGKTIPEEKLERIFEQFFRIDTSRASATGGAGLGLAIAREIVELHGGKIQARSEEETVTFTITIPADCQKIV